MLEHAILEALPVGLWVADARDGRVVFSNEAFSEIMGMNAVAEVPIEGAPSTYGICDRRGEPYPVDRLPFSRVIASGRPEMVDDIVIHRIDGRWVDIRAFAQPIRDASGAMTHVIVAFIDITAEITAERAQQEAHSRLQMALQHAPMGIFSVDTDGIVTLLEGAALSALGLAPGELVGQSVFSRYPDNTVLHESMRRGLAGESLWFTAEVGERSFNVWLAPQRDRSGAQVGVLGVFTDITELRRLQTAAVRDDRIRTVGTMAASVAHEINNPLMYIGGNLEQIRRELAALRGIPDAQAALVRIEAALSPVERGLERITAITRQLGAFSRPAHGPIGGIDPRAAVEGVLELARKEVESRASLSIDLGHRSAVRGDEVRLVQVLLNLVLNAAQSSRGHQIALRTRDEPRDGAPGVIFQVDDTGPGIPAHQREQVFEAFFSTKEAGEGTGLGLFVCRTIIDQLGGSIRATEAPGGGARFEVWLPAAERTERSPERSAPAAQGRILVVDDEDALREVLSRTLRIGGFEVTTAADGESALSLLQTGSFDLVYCDLMMRGMTGIDLYETLAERSPELLDRVLFMTGGAYTETAAEFVQTHPERCLFKPFDIVATTRSRLS